MDVAKGTMVLVGVLSIIEPGVLVYKEGKVGSPVDPTGIVGNP